MKRIAAFFLSLLTIAFSLLPTVQAAATPVNLIANPSVETSTNGVTPDNWAQGGWGTNDRALSYQATGHGSGHSLKTQITSYTDGDAKWYFTPVNVTTGTTYNFSDYYMATVPTDLVVQFDNGSSYAYQWLATVPAAASWAQASSSFTVPAGYTHASVFHLLNGVGTLQTDDYTLAGASNVSVNITAPAPNSSVSGASVVLSADASSDTGIAGVQFKMDGVSVGSEVTTAPYQTTWNSTTATNGTHNLTATARATDGTTATTAATQITVNNPTAPGTNIIPNPSVETTMAGNTKLPANWQSSKWGTNTAAFTYTAAANAHTGSHGLKVQISQYTDGDAKWYFTPQAVDPAKLYTFSDYYKSSTESYVVADFGMSDGSDQYLTLGTLAKATAWTKFEEQFSVPQGAVTVTVFHLIHSVGQVTTDDYSLSSYNPVGFNRALVSLTFDDAWASVYTNGLPILQKYGFHSTQYLLSGNTSDPDYMTTSMMLALKNAGEEIASHTITHRDLTTLTSTQLKQELVNSQKSLKQWTGAPVNNFASPYGAADQNTITQIKKYYSSHRGIVSGFNSKNYFNAYDIKVQDITSTTSLSQIQAWVAQAQATHTWLVLVYHQVSDSPQAGDYNTPPAVLDAQFSAIKDSGIAVVTVEQALTELKAQL